MTLSKQIKAAELDFAFAQGKRDQAIKEYNRKELKLQRLRREKPRKGANHG